MRPLLAALAFLVPMTACATGAPDADPDAADTTVVEGTLQPFGDATIRYAATLDARERLVRIVQWVDLGDYGSYEEVFLLEDEHLVESNRQGEDRVLSGDRAGEMEKVHRLFRFNRDGSLAEATGTVNGSAVEPGAHEHEGVLAQVDELRRVVAVQRTQQAFPDRRALAGTWRASSPSGGTYSLELFMNHAASARVDLRGNPTLMLRGFWRSTPEQGVDVVFTRIEGDPMSLESWNLHAEGNDRLVDASATWEFTRLGGPIPAGLLGVTWEWTGFVNPVEAIEVDDPGRYTLRFEPDGTIHLRADCNRANGTVILGPGGSTAFAPMAATLAACPDGSLNGRFLTELGRATHYFIRDGRLYFDLPVDSGTLSFRPGS